MIYTAKQLKDKVRNISKGDNNIAKTLIWNFMMERFLERVSLSRYNDHFILKGGMLVASIVGVNMRATMDIDTTVKTLPLNEEDIRRIISEICAIPIEDGVSFQITSVSNIMEDFEYPGIRLMLEAVLERMRQPIKIDISTDDVITPAAVEYNYKLMFEERTIMVLSYNKETLLAEKIQTILARGIANTRLRDFYDVYEVMKMCADDVDAGVFREAYEATCTRRDTVFSKDEIKEILDQLKENEEMRLLWDRFQEKNYYVENQMKWQEVLENIIAVIVTYLM